MAYETILKSIENSVKKFKTISSLYEMNRFREEITEKIFIAEMGYRSPNPLIVLNEKNIIINNKLIIKTVSEKALDTELMKCFKTIDERIKWAIVISLKGIWLLYNRKNKSDKNIFQTGYIVLSILFFQGADRKYFKYFSFDNILGQHPNTYYFKDILEYKNGCYKGGDKSWGAYSSALKRFINYQIERGMNYNLNIDNKDNYSFIESQDFCDYVCSVTEAKTENTIKNAYFYLKDFMNKMTNNHTFQGSSEDALRWFKMKRLDNEREDVINFEKLRRAAEYLQEGRYGVRDAALFNMLVQFGLERRKICNMKWADISLSNNPTKENSTIFINGLRFIIPKTLEHSLFRLKEKNPNTKYVFCRSYKDDIPVKEGTINYILGKLAKANPGDSFYKHLNPANIRNSLVRYYLNTGHHIDDIAFYMDLEFYNLESYISREELSDSVSRRLSNNSFSISKVDILGI